MKKAKQIAALIGIIFLVGLYIVTLIAACFSSPASSGLFLACVYATITIPVLLWAYQFIYKLVRRKNNGDETDSSRDDVQ